MRRPPQLWEQKLSRVTSILGVGISSSGDGTSIVEPSPPPGDGGGIEPAPVLPAPGTFKTPSTPTLSGTVQGIRVSWNGLNSDGDPYPTGAYVEVHISTTGATFTPDATTLAGTLLGSAGFFTIGALTAGTTYYVRLVGVDEAGNKTSPSTAASSQTGLTTTSDYGTATIDAGAVSFNARQIGGVTSTVGTATPTNPVVGDIWLDTTGGATTHKRWNGSTWETILFGSGSIATSAITSTKIADDAITTPKIAANAVTAAEIAANTITASQIAANTITSTNLAAGAVTAGAIAAGAVTTAKLDASAVTADKIAAGAITATKLSADAIDGKTITGASLRTAASGARVELGSAFGVLSTVGFYSSAGFHGSIGSGINTAELLLAPGSGGTITANGPLTANGNFSAAGYKVTCQQFEVTGANADFTGLTTGATTADAGFNGDRLRKKTSTQRYKYDIAAVDGAFTDVDPERQVDVVTVNPHDLLNVAVAEYSWLEDGEPTEWRELGFIAEDVAAKFPIAASIGPDGQPIAVRDTPILAALLAIVRDQQATIADLTARIEALEA